MSPRNHVKSISLSEWLAGAIRTLILLSGPLCGMGQSPVTYTATVAEGGNPIGQTPTNSIANIEGYSPFTGMLSPTIPLYHVGGRGDAQFDLVLTLPQLWTTTTSITAAYPSPATTGQTLPVYTYKQQFVPPWNSSAPIFSAGTVTGTNGSVVIGCPYGGHSTVDVFATFTFVTFSGPSIGTLDLYDGWPTQTSDPCTQENQSKNFGRYNFWDADSPGLVFLSDTNLRDALNPSTVQFSVNGVVVLLANGVQYRVDNSTVSWIRDRNGNKITFSYSSGKLTSITDSIGRIVAINYSDPSCNCITVTYPGAAGAPRTIKVSTTSLQNALRSGSSLASYNQLFAEDTTDQGNYNPVIVSSVEFPDSTQYSFEYDSYGELAQLTIPTGATFQYDYASGAPNSSDGYQASSSGAFSMVYRRLQERRQYAAGGTLVGKTDYTASSSSSSTNVTIASYDASSNVLSSETRRLIGSPLDAINPPNYLGLSCNAWDEGFESETDYGFPSTLKTITKTYLPLGQTSPPSPDSPCMFAYPATTTSITTTLSDNGQVSQVLLQHDQFGNVSDRQETDWGSGAPGPLLRDTQTNYLIDTSSEANYYYAGWPLPVSQTVLDANKNVLAQTQWNYDETPVTANSGMTGHDDANYGTSFNYRGNLTSELHWLKTSNSWIKTKSSTYDVAGNVLTTTDANGHTTNFSYADNFSDGQFHGAYGFIAQITNALNQSSKSQFDYGLGEKTATTDINGNTTSYVYTGSGYGVDGIGQINFPNGAHAYYSYPGPTQAIVQRDQNTSGDAALKSQTLLDSFGRVIETDTFESASSYIGTTTTYDALGRVIATTNPSRPGDGLNFVTSYTYDPIGRPYQIKTPDGGIAAVAYSGNMATVTDQQGKAKQYTSDGLGRLTKVIEDPGGTLNYTTTYSYDILNNLTSVTQGSQTRTFSYDSLSRLQSAANPESGTVTYTYDNAGNVLSRKDNRGTTTTYTYDSLNRPKSISYSDNITPSVSYTYDAANIQNSLGKLTSVANSNSTTTYTGFNAVGNVLASTQTTAGQSYSFAYSYNLAGALTSETFPSGRIVSTIYDGANRASSVSGKLNGAQTNYAQSVLYAPHGAVTGFAMGNNVTPAFGYNSRLQPTLAQATLGYSPSAYLFAEQPNWGTTNNNGMLRSVTVQAGGPGALSSLPNYTATFTYDNVNRLASVSDTGGYSRSFSYDQYGNMWVPPGWTGIAPTAPTSNVYSANNQIGPACNQAGTNYDCAGNVISTGSTAFSYDAENHQLSATDEPSIGGGNVNYYYDGLGQRVEKLITSGAATAYVYDGFGQLAAEYSDAQNTSPCATCYLSWDHLGTPRLITDASGTVMTRHDYLPFGEEIPANTVGRGSQWGSTTDIESKFTGQIRDNETGNDFFHARYYTSSYGRFMSPDPANAGADITNPQSWNAYAYVLGNPLALVDPSGMDTNEAGLQTGICPASKANCPPPGPPSEIDTAEANYVKQVVIPGYLNGAAARYPNLIQLYWPSGAASVVITYGKAGEILKQSAENVPADPLAGLTGDPTVGMNIWQGQQQLWHNTATVGNALGAATAAVSALPLAPAVASGASSAASWTANATGLLGPAAGRVFWSAIGPGAAAEWAEENGGSTLEMSPLGSFANWVQGYLPQTSTTGAAWNWLSAAFARGAQGAVTYLQGPYIGNTWRYVERPILVMQGNPINTVPVP